jgi:hypothetical protein
MKTMSEAVQEMQFDSSLARYRKARSVKRKKLGELYIETWRTVITNPSGEGPTRSWKRQLDFDAFSATALGSSAENLRILVDQEDKDVWPAGDAQNQCSPRASLGPSGPLDLDRHRAEAKIWLMLGIDLGCR